MGPVDREVVRDIGARQRNRDSAAVEPVLVFRPWDYFLYTVLTLPAVVSAWIFFRYWFSLEIWGQHPLALSIASAMLMTNLSFALGSWLLLPQMRKPRPMAARPNWRVGVVTTFVPGSESMEMLEESLVAMMAIEYPHETWVLDEGDDDRVKSLCRRVGAFHFSF